MSIDTTQQYRVVMANAFKQGTSNKDGKIIPWTIFKTTLEGYNGEVTGFDAVNPGDLVTLIEKQNGQYTNINYVKVKADAAPVATATQPATGQAPAPSAGVTDKRALKLLVAIAEQVGVPTDTVNAILDERV